jgi:hypothetical protein
MLNHMPARQRKAMLYEPCGLSMGSNVIERTDFGRNSVSAHLFQIRFRPKLEKNDFGTSPMLEAVFCCVSVARR